MMLRYSFQLEDEASSIERAVELALEAGLRTRDLARSGEQSVSTEEMGRCVVNSIEHKSL
jgi:3-isopropylmalate dehydrogenase